jgi:predicted RNase H-like HicB family nuclease
MGGFWLAKSFITLVFVEMAKYEMIIYWSEVDGSFIVEVPELSGCMADGLKYIEAVKSAETAINIWIEVAKELGREIPTPKGKLMYA